MLQTKKYRVGKIFHNQTYLYENFLFLAPFIAKFSWVFEFEVSIDKFDVKLFPAVISESVTEPLFTYKLHCPLWNNLKI